jgi:ribosomal protein S18 acetylase RimI-like enzyme
MGGSFAITPAHANELPSALDLVFRHLAEEERTARVANALWLLRQGELDAEGVLVVRGENQLLGAVVCQAIAGASALVWPPVAVPGEQQKAIEDQLLACATSWLKRRGAKLAQTLLTPQENFLSAPLLRNGFRLITTLWYLGHSLKLPADSVTSTKILNYQAYEHTDQDLFHRTLLRSYENTRDCPEVNGVRDLAEIIEGHRAQGVNTPDYWWLATAEGNPVGVLLMAEIPEFGSYDLSYVGVVPEARRRGFGKALTRKALLAARAAGAAQLSLAVDARNRPAWNLYLELDFEPFDQREVYLAIWNKGSWGE